EGFSPSFCPSSKQLWNVGNPPAAGKKVGRIVLMWGHVPGRFHSTSSQVKVTNATDGNNRFTDLWKF
ncbi:MAG: hypothetical protein KAG93_00365, partial [Desulfuromusa sp.]|nr:hypothetical protein [Desulfuromusa sp.]